MTSVDVLLVSILLFFGQVKYTHMKNAPSNKTQALMKSITLDIYVDGTLNQLLIRGSYNQF